MQARGGSEGALELGHERATSRQSDDVFERTKPRFASTRNATRIPALSHGQMFGCAPDGLEPVMLSVTCVGDAYF